MIRSRTMECVRAEGEWKLGWSWFKKYKHKTPISLFVPLLQEKESLKKPIYHNLPASFLVDDILAFTLSLVGCSWDAPFYILYPPTLHIWILRARAAIILIRYIIFFRENHVRTPVVFHVALFTCGWTLKHAVVLWSAGRFCKPSSVLALSDRGNFHVEILYAAGSKLWFEFVTLNKSYLDFISWISCWLKRVDD